MHQVFLEDDGNPTTITRWKPSGKVWEELSTEAFEQRIVSACAGLFQICPDPKTTPDEFQEKLTNLKSEVDGKEVDVFSLAREEFYSLGMKTEWMVTPYEAWWAHAHASLFFDCMCTEEGTPFAAEKNAKEAMGDRDDLRKSSRYVNLLWNFLLERKVQESTGIIAASMFHSALSGNINAVNAYTRAYNPEKSIVRTEKSLTVRGASDSIDPERMSEQETMAEVAKLRKLNGEKAENPLSEAKFLEEYMDD